MAQSRSCPLVFVPESTRTAQKLTFRLLHPVERLKLTMHHSARAQKGGKSAMPVQSTDHVSGTFWAALAL
jgi:hypothetical protein